MCSRGTTKQSQCVGFCIFTEIYVYATAYNILPPTCTNTKKIAFYPKINPPSMKFKKSTKYVDQVVQCLSSQTSPFYNLYIYLYLYIYILVIQLSVLFIKRVHFICHSYNPHTSPAVLCSLLLLLMLCVCMCVFVCASDL